MPYAIYLRKSRSDRDAELRGEGETLARHEKALLELARRQHLDITQIYREIVTGDTIAARPEMQKLLADVDEGLYDGVLVMEVERLARGDTLDQGIVSQAFKFSGTKIVTPLKTYDPSNEYDEEYFEFGLFMSRREFNTIKRRLQSGRIASVKEGKFVGNVAPYGYAKVKLEKDKGYTLTPIPEEADTVRLIYDLYTKERIGVGVIATRLNALGLTPRIKDHWTASTIRDILSNPVYIGMIRWNNRKTQKRRVDGQITTSRPRNEHAILVPGLHPAILSNEQFDAAQEIRKTHPALPITRDATVHNPLCSLLRCGVCGRHMIRRPQGSRQSADVVMCPDPHCTTVGSYLSVVEDAILDALTEYAEKIEVQSIDEIPETAGAVKQKEKALAANRSERQKLHKQVDSLHDLLEQGVYSTDVFLDRSKTLSDKIQANEKEYDRLQTELHYEQSRLEHQVQILPKINHLLSVYRDLPNPQAKNDLLRSVLEKVVYTKTNRTRWGGTLTVEIFPLLSHLD